MRVLEGGYEWVHCKHCLMKNLKQRKWQVWGRWNSGFIM